MSKFFTDHSETHTFSIDKVVAFKKGIQFSPSSPISDKSKFYPTIEVTLASDGSLHNINILYVMEERDKRDLDYARLCRALSYTNS